MLSSKKGQKSKEKNTLNPYGSCAIFHVFSCCMLALCEDQTSRPPRSSFSNIGSLEKRVTTTFFQNSQNLYVYFTAVYRRNEF